MKLLGRKKEVTAPEEAADAESAGEDAAPVTETAGSRTTAPKGRPTPKRSEAAKRRGPIAPAPMTAAEARARRKAMAGPKLSREERRLQKAERRERMTERREKMMAGDEAYLLPRDQGPVRRFARDVVDARRNVLGLFMPSALGLLFISMAVVQLQFYLYPAMLVLMAVMAVDAVILARKVNRLADAKFPDNVESRWKLGLYAAGRASQLRRMRAPRPQVNRGEKVE
ncbi:DUF3043 domain-containing protein [Mycobacterium talmoniae]|uniref:DUF3043 domain-containing protein n=1 Tax=Mycobacterium talmoniae TaxID=1858794 RepID=A0A1S1MIJ9_9MYCO|nr:MULTISPECIES: DUF3043 domain-containing protein [Mycobacterium]OHU82697.1 hypothetical protein BKN37_26895 [Mycobacterium talmoniae]TDH47890.1 DUF3043 domain-containing protein [Mycobacterium eburneum]